MIFVGKSDVLGEGEGQGNPGAGPQVRGKRKKEKMKKLRETSEKGCAIAINVPIIIDWAFLQGSGCSLDHVNIAVVLGMNITLGST